MARARNIKPSFFINEELVELDFATRLLFIGLWTIADRDGRLEDKPKKIKMSLFPADDIDVNNALNELQSSGFIKRYEISNNQYIQILAFKKHQNPHIKEPASNIPAPCENGASTVQELNENDASHADSLLLIPDSPLPIKPLVGNGVANCPHQEIILLYAKHLPMLSQVKVWSDARAKNLKARWAENSKRQNLDWWDKFFAYVATSDFLTGRDGVWQNCDLEWLVKSANFIKVIEGKYENKADKNG